MDEQPEFRLPPSEATDPFESASERRARPVQMQKILDNPENYFFCEACGNIFKRGGPSEQTGICLICHGYRFNYEPKDIREQAIRSCSRPRNSVVPADYV